MCHPEDTVYLKARLRVDYLQSEMKQRRSERGANDVTREERVATTVKQEGVILVA